MYSVEIFDINYNLVDHSNVNDIDITEDYLSTVSNKILIKLSKNVEPGMFILIFNNDNKFSGIVNAVDNRNELVEITFSSLLTLFDVNLLIDTNLQGLGTCENFFKKLIEDRFVNNQDTLANIKNLNVKTSSVTTGWGFNLKSDKENMHMIIANLLNLIRRAFIKYNLVIDIDFDGSKLDVNISVNDNQKRVIEADLNNIIDKNIIIKKTDNHVNSLKIYNANNYSQYVTYYLHSDDTFSANNINRVVPVIQNEIAIDFEITQSFQKVAFDSAKDFFNSIQYNNLIELTMLSNDNLVKPKELKIGQIVDVISKNQTYTSILTSKNISSLTTLVFGTVRLDLSKKIKKGI